MTIQVTLIEFFYLIDRGVRKWNFNCFVLIFFASLIAHVAIRNKTLPNINQR